MKYIIFFLFPVLLTNLDAQTGLDFNKKFVDSEDKWVAFEKNEEGEYLFGFIYIDPQAGLTLNTEGTFTINQDGTFVPEKMDSINMKIRLQPNNVEVAFIPEKRFAELGIASSPEWLKFYKTDTSSVEHLYRWGYLYNAWGKCEKALTYLEKAQEINPKFDGLEFELAYAYNALAEYDKAIVVLTSALETDPKGCYLYKELSYAEMHSGELEKAALSCEKGISFCKEKTMKCEIAYNLAYQYYKIKDYRNFKKWAAVTRKYATRGDQFYINIQSMESGPW